MDNQGETGKYNENDSENNPQNSDLVLEDKIKYNPDYNHGSNYVDEINNNANTVDENSLHLDKYIDKIQQSAKFREKEAEYVQKIEDFIVSKTGNINIKSSWNKIVFAFNYFLILSTFIEFLFQRFDVVTLSLCFIIFFIKLEFFSYKHLYKWLFYLFFTIILDLFVIIDVFPVSKFNFFINFKQAGELYLESSSGSTMSKGGLLVILVNLLLKLIVGFGLWRMAMNYRAVNNNNNAEDISQNPNYYVDEPINEGM